MQHFRTGFTIVHKYVVTYSHTSIITHSIVVATLSTAINPVYGQLLNLNPLECFSVDCSTVCIKSFETVNFHRFHR